jgi:hypothetical protein
MVCLYTQSAGIWNMMAQLAREDLANVVSALAEKLDSL